MNLGRFKDPIKEAKDSIGEVGSKMDDGQGNTFVLDVLSKGVAIGA